MNMIVLTISLCLSMTVSSSIASSVQYPDSCRSTTTTLRCIAPKTLEYLIPLSSVSNVEVDCLGRTNISELSSLSGSVQMLSVIRCSLKRIAEELLLKETRMVYLDLRFNNLKEDNVLFKNIQNHGAIVDYVLQNLDLSYNKITTIPNGISKFRNLKAMRLDHNDISTISEGSFSSLKNLMFLTLQGNNLKELTDDMFGSMPYLNTLDLSDNQIDNISLSAFNDVPQLLRLDLSNNSIPKLVTGQLKYVSSLTHLNLSNNMIHDIEYDFIENCSSLQTLDLSRNSVTQLSNGIFRTCSSLTYLTLEHNKIHFIEDMAFNGLSFLFVLNLNKNKLTTLGSCLQPMANLGQVHLNDNQLNLIEKDNFFSNYRLHKVDLSNNSISNIGNSSFRGISYVNLHNNKISYFEMNTFKNTARLNLILTSNPLSHLNPAAFISTQIDVIRFSEASFSAYPKEICPKLTLQVANHGIVLPFESIQNCTRVRNLFITNTSVLGHDGSTWEEFWGLVKLEMSELPSRLPWKLLELTIRNADLLDIPADYTFFPINGIHLLDLTNSTLKNLNFLKYIDVRTLILDQINLNDSLASIGDKPVDVRDSISMQFCNLHYIPVIFKSVEEINLRGNYITSIRPIDKYLKLQKLDLSENKITTIPSGLFANLLAIKEINLSNNMISIIETEFFPPTTHMELRLVDTIYIDISNNKLRTIEKDVWTPILYSKIQGYINFTGNPLQCHCGMNWFSNFILERQLSNNSSLPILEGTCLSPKPLHLQHTISEDYHCSVKINNVFQTNLPHDVISVTCVAEGHPSPYIDIFSPTRQNLLHQTSPHESMVTYGTYTATRTYMTQQNITFVICSASVGNNMTVTQELHLDLSMKTSPRVDKTVQSPKYNKSDNDIDVSTAASTAAVKGYTTMDIIGAVIGTFLCTLILSAVVICIFVYFTRKKQDKFFSDLYKRTSSQDTPPSVVYTMSETLANSGNTLRVDHDYASIESIRPVPNQHLNLTYESEKKPSRFIKKKPPVTEKPKNMPTKKESNVKENKAKRLSEGEKENQYQDIDYSDLAGASNVSTNMNEVSPNTGYNNMAFIKSEDDYVAPEDDFEQTYQNDPDNQYQSVDDDQCAPDTYNYIPNEAEDNCDKTSTYQDMEESEEDYVKPDDNSTNDNDSLYQNSDNAYQNAGDSEYDTHDSVVPAVKNPYEDLNAESRVSDVQKPYQTLNNGGTVC